LCAILLYIFVFLVLNNAAVAFWSGLIFVIHPIHAEVVNIVSFREDILVGIFALFSLITYILYKRQSYFKRSLFYGLSVLSFSLALFSKEMAITIPALIILYDLYFEYNGELKHVFINFRSRYLGFLIVSIFYLYVNFIFFANPEGGAAAGYIGGTLYANMLTMAVIFSDYITSFWFPLNMKIIPVYYAPITTAFFSRDAILAVSLIAMFLILAFKLSKKSKAASFFIFWFFLALLPISNIIPIVNPMAYRYVYFPVIGFCVVLGIILRWLEDSKILKKISANLYRILQITIIVFFIAATIPHNVFYRSRFTYAKEALRSFPKNHQSLGDMGFAALESGDYIRALIYFNSIAHDGQYDPGTILNIGICYDHLEKFDLAIEQYKIALILKPDYSSAYYNIGIAYLKKGDYKNAIANFAKTKELDHRFANAYRFTAEAYLKQKKTKLAIAELKKGLEIIPEDKDLQELLFKTETKPK
jgi:tetratricopeptide (TPR) repeat protein